jgi:hypothetical protein
VAEFVHDFFLLVSYVLKLVIQEFPVVDDSSFFPAGGRSRTRTAARQGEERKSGPLLKKRSNKIKE